MNLIELKSQAYDTLAQLEALQLKLQQLNNAIRNYKETEEPKKE
jgi:hypothetical protein